MSGGKGGSSTSETTVPQYIEDAARANLSRADEISKIGYTPYYGPDVAAFTPMQEASFQNTADMASAFGMGGGKGGGRGGGMPEPTTYANGVRGYSSAPLYEQSLAQLRRERPGQYAAMTAPFIDPVTGAAPSAPYAGYNPIARSVGGAAGGQPMSSASGGDYGGGGDQGQSNFGGSGGVGGFLGGYTSVGDMLGDMLGDSGRVK